MESRTQGSRPRPKTQKKIRGQGQGQGQPFRGQTLSRPRTGMLEAKAKDQGHKAKCSPKKKKKKKRSSQKFFKRSPLKNVFQKIFQALHKLLTFQKIVLSSSRGQANFRGLEAKAKDLTFEAKAKDFKMCPRGQGRPRGLHLWLLPTTMYQYHNLYCIQGGHVARLCFVPLLWWLFSTNLFHLHLSAFASSSHRTP